MYESSETKLQEHPFHIMAAETHQSQEYNQNVSLLALWLFSPALKKRKCIIVSYLGFFFLVRIEQNVQIL